MISKCLPCNRQAAAPRPFVQPFAQPSAQPSAQLFAQPAAQGRADPAPAKRADLAAIRAYYRATADDFRAWSPDLNMHFGYWRPGLNPFRREPMLVALSEEVIQRLKLPRDKPSRVADLGCGGGASARALVRLSPRASVDAVTISPEQISRGQALNARAGAQNISFHLADYAHTALPTGRFDGLYAIESACHANGPGKHELLREMARLARPGARLVVADAFRRNARPLPRPVRWLYHTWCADWVVPELAQLDSFCEALRANGFAGVQVEEISHRIAFSAAHIPFLATAFTLKTLWQTRGRLGGWRLKHIVASYCAFLMGLYLPAFGYFIISATREPS